MGVSTGFRREQPGELNLGVDGGYRNEVCPRKESDEASEDRLIAVWKVCENRKKPPGVPLLSVERLQKHSKVEQGKGRREGKMQNDSHGPGF